ncbi:hypothetical protein PR202_ga20486 [Eleusine coracana subsp. coracana]|uniref:DUF4094 domain-containing protein n=1 Tax=Eleusine coracana subsp. coracana TaxID=191504 RepID=A0AAV5CXU0_ELECO|nr:hypothetical protein PR202_ga20486 [Eleusine coracana subsp. coracana]
MARALLRNVLSPSPSSDSSNSAPAVLFQQEVRRDRELEEKGAARSGSHELEEMGGVSRRWVILLCVSSFCLGLLFTNRARDKMIASLETELLAARSLQESLLNGPLFWKTSKFLNRLGSGNIKWSQESILHLAVAREEIPYVTLGHLPPSGQEVLMASTNCHDLIGDGGYRMADDDEQTAMAGFDTVENLHSDTGGSTNTPDMKGPGPSRPAGDFPELLGFCARAETLIAELLLLSDRAPSQFADSRFDPVLFDFRYFDSPADFESRIDGNIEMEALEDQLRESCSLYMQRFFALLDGAVTYHGELCSYLKDLQWCMPVASGVHGFVWMHDSASGTQNWWVLRERLLVAHLRYERCFSHPNLEQICELCRRHVPIPGSPASSGSSLFFSEVISVQKPEDLLGRFPFPEPVVDAVIICLRNDDVYNNIRFYPDPQHRSTALSLQGGHLYVLLFYSRDLLHKADLLVSWDAYKEAKISLVSSLSPASIRDISTHHYTKVPHLLADLDIHMRALNNKYVLDNSSSLLSIIRECNFTLRWLLLHRLVTDAKYAWVYLTLFETLLKKNITKIFAVLDVIPNLGGWLRQMIERELAAQLEGQLKHISSPTYGDIESNLNSLSNHMLSQMQRVEFLQDVLHIDGSSIWQETLTIVLEQCAKKELLELTACMERSANVVKQLNNLSSPSTVFGLMWEDMNCLVDTKSQHELNMLDDLLGPPMSIPLMGLSSYKAMVKMFHSSWGLLVEKLATIGQLQLVRNLISFKMRSACKIKAKAITSAVEILVCSLHMQKQKCERGAEDQTVQPLHHNIKEQQNFCGLLPPLEAVYISEDPPMFLTRLLTLFSISQLSRYVLDVHLGNLTSPLKGSIADFSAVIVGLGTFLRQFKSFYTTQYIQFMVQYIRTVEAAFDATSDTHKGSTHSSEAPKAVFWLMSFCKYMDISRDVVESCLSSSALAILQS